MIGSWLTLLLLGAGGSALPPQDPRFERSILEDGAEVSGRWATTAAAVRAETPAALWLARGEFNGGTLRARVSAGPDSEATLVFGVAEGAGLSGYGLRLTDHWAQLSTLGGDDTRPLDAVMLPRDAKRRAVEVLISAFADVLLVRLYDADTGAALALTSLSGAHLLGSGVGLSTGPSPQSTGALSLLTVRDACSGTPAGVDPWRSAYVVLPEDEAELARPTALALEPVADGVAFAVGGLELERLWCEGRTLVRLSTELPWKYHDLGYLWRRDALPPRGGAGFDLDASDKSPALIESLLRAWAREYPDRARLEVLGQSREGRPILALAITLAGDDAPARPAILLAAAHHGDELSSTEVALDAAGTLLASEEPEVRRWLTDVVVWCVPMVNPDGVHAFLEESERAGRKNGFDANGDGRRGRAEGVDLNRNYPFRWEAPGDDCERPSSRNYHGTAPASEPETQAMMRLAARERFVAAFSYHQGARTILVPYTVDDVQSPEPNEAWAVAEEIALRLPPHPEGGTISVRHKIVTVQGTDEDWLRHRFGTVAYILEVAGWPPPATPGPRRALREGLRPTWRELLRRWTNGPTLAGRVHDVTGAAIEAEVTVAEQRLRAGEVWTTRPRDGRFHRFVVKPGRYHVRVRAPGFRPVERVVDVPRGRAEVDIVLPPG